MASQKTLTKSQRQAVIYAVIKHIMSQKGEMTAMKLHKLLYYCQAWSLVWDEEPLFDQKIEAWANGPVIPVVYQHHRGRFKITPNEDWINLAEDIELTPSQIETIDAVLQAYGDKDSAELSQLTHREDPWLEAREGVPVGERSSNEITHAAMGEYYSSPL